MVSDRKLANVVGGKSARACDNCIKKRARWYCAADDAFLCQSCDSSVHSANTLSRRHERVLLKTASIKSFSDQPKPKVLHVSTTWHKGFTRKARTPRGKKKNYRFSSDNNNNVIDDVSHSNGSNIDNNNVNPLHLVPEICSEENSHGENDVQLLYRVPIFEPFDSRLCTSNEPGNAIQGAFRENKDRMAPNDFGGFGDQEMSHLQGFLPSEMDFAEFAADVESLLGKGLEDESFDMKDLGLSDNSKECERSIVKLEDELHEVDYNSVNIIGVDGHGNDDGEMFDVGRESFELNFDYDSPIATTACDEDEEENKGKIIIEPMAIMNNYINLGGVNNNDDKKGFDSTKMILKLDYEGVMSAWDDQKSPWTTGEGRNIDSVDCWRPDCMGTCGTMHNTYGGDIVMMSSSHSAAMASEGREARVSRYREKRRTRLFSKKIRYEVRKLNAEKRPRMKGRFVKRSSNLAAAASTAFI